MIEGVDYSAVPYPGAPGSAALLAAGKRFAVRYLADDWRGITPAEYQELTLGGIEVAAVFESWGDRREFSGENQGITDAVFAQNKLLRTGMPPAMPVYFATDWDAAASDMPFVDAYLVGAAKVLGAERVGVYGGYSVIDHCHSAGSASWFWQTSAWEYGRGVHPAAHLYQYAYNVWINGTNCDATQARQENYGQASSYLPHPDAEPPAPVYPAPILPPWYARVNAQASPSSARFGGHRWYPQRANVEALADTYVYTEPDTKSAHAGEPIAAGTKIAVEWIFAGAGDHLWLVNGDGYHYGAKFAPALQLPESR